MVALELINIFEIKWDSNKAEHGGDRAGVTIEVIAVDLHFPGHYSIVKYILRVSLRS